MYLNRERGGGGGNLCEERSRGIFKEGEGGRSVWWQRGRENSLGLLLNKKNIFCFRFIVLWILFKFFFAFVLSFSFIFYLILLYLVLQWREGGIFTFSFSAMHFIYSFLFLYFILLFIYLFIYGFIYFIIIFFFGCFASQKVFEELIFIIFFLFFYIYICLLLLFLLLSSREYEATGHCM